MNKSNLKETQASVLIDTWWNVNLAQSHWEKVAYKVLIDTWWNVN